MIAHLFIGVLLADRAQQEYSSDAISNRSMNRVLVAQGKSCLAKSSRGRRVQHGLVLATRPQERAAKENREGG
jgi:hypothetical protein